VLSEREDPVGPRSRSAAAAVRAMLASAPLEVALLDPGMRRYFSYKFANVSDEELKARIEETLKFLFICHECTGPIPVTKEIDEVWHAWILQTQEYMELCDRLPTGRFIHHSSNDYLSHFDPLVGQRDNLTEDVKMLALYVANFGPFEASRTKYWRLASHLLARHRWSVEQLNDWLQTTGPSGTSAGAQDSMSGVHKMR
jgi:hypothetical protein